MGGARKDLKPKNREVIKMKWIALVSVLLLVWLAGCSQSGEQTEIEDFMAVYRARGTISDSLLTELEAHMRTGYEGCTRDTAWVQKQADIERRIALEDRLNRLREMERTGTDVERTAATEKITQLLKAERERKEKNR